MPTPPPFPTLSDDELMRYSRQILMPAFDIEGQQSLKSARVLIVGCGGLGCPAALYLGSAGVGHLVLADDDIVESANLQRQIGFSEADLGKSKAQALAKRLNAINPLVMVTAVSSRLAGDKLQNAISEADLVLDCSDNFATRFAINDACLKARTPLVSGAAIRAQGQITVFDSRQSDSPCYRCLFPDEGEQELTCSEAGVIGPLVGMIGSAQAMEAIKVLTGKGKPLTGRLLILDAWTMEWRSMGLAKDPNCGACSQT
mgnify:FL=1